MKKQYRLATFALSACLLMACGARETNAPENNEAEKQTENISNIDTKIDEAETSGVGAGVYASHGYERSHVDGVKNTLELLAAYLDK